MAVVGERYHDDRTDGRTVFLTGIQALMFDTQYLQLCMTLMTLDHRHREDVSAMGCLPFLHRCDDDLVLVEPWESRDAVLL